MHSFRVATQILILVFFISLNLNAEYNNLPDLQGEEYLAFAEEMPQPVGGLKAIYKFIEYPDIAKRAGVEGKVYVLAFINEQGSVDDVKVVKGIGAGCDEATIEAVRKTKFSPGKSAGKSAKIKMSLQIEFKLS